MKIAVISDIHSNLEALQEVLSDIERTGAERVFCLGDCVGYGPDPERVSTLVRSLQIPTVMGNHELGIVRTEYLNWFNDSAKKSLMLTKELISDETLRWIGTLEATIVFQDALFVHGSPPDSIIEYLFELTDDDFHELFPEMTQRICFVGHTHIMESVSWKNGHITKQPLTKGTMPLDNGSRYIVNIGSVGQPRDGDRSSKYVVWDSSENTLDVRFVPYDAKKTADKIIRLGFPRINADRLL